MSQVQLQASNGDVYDVDLKTAQKAAGIKNLTEDIEGAMLIPLPEISSPILEKVVEYMNAHANDAAEVVPGVNPEDPKDTQFISAADRKILGINPDNSLSNLNQVYDIIKAANYLEYRPLLKTGTLAVANSIRGKSVEGMRAALNIRT